MDEGGWPYADPAAGLVGLEPIDLRSDADDDLVALHALRRGAIADLSDDLLAQSAGHVADQAREGDRPIREGAHATDDHFAVQPAVEVFGLGGAPPMSMIELRTELGLSRDRTRVALSGGLSKLRQALADDGR